MHVWGRNLCAVTAVWLSDPSYSRRCTAWMPNLEFTIFTYTFSEKGHLSLSCTKPAVANDYDSTSIVHSIKKKLAKETKNLKKAFTQLQKTSK
jgi:hypothetical protein